MKALFIFFLFVFLIAKYRNHNAKVSKKNAIVKTFSQKKCEEVRNKSQILCIFGFMNVVDIDSFIARTGKSKAGLSRDLGFDPKSSLLAAYQAGRTKPS